MFSSARFPRYALGISASPCTAVRDIADFKVPKMLRYELGCRAFTSEVLLRMLQGSGGTLESFETKTQGCQRLWAALTLHGR